MCINLIVYLTSIFCYGVMFAIAMMPHADNCNYVLASDFVFWVA